MSISQTTSNNGAVLPNTSSRFTLTPDQVKNVYFGLKSAEIYKRHYNECLEVANSLNEIIQQQNDSIVAMDQRLEEFDYHINELYDERERSAVEIQQIKSKKTPWYRHPITLGILGFITGVWVAK